MAQSLPSLDFPCSVLDIAHEEPCRVYVRYNLPPSWGDPRFQGVFEDADQLETLRSPCFDHYGGIVSWLTRHGCSDDRARWLVDQILRHAEENSTDGTADPEY